MQDVIEVENIRFRLNVRECDVFIILISQKLPIFRVFFHFDGLV